MLENREVYAGTLWSNRQVRAGEEIKLEIDGHTLATKTVQEDGWWICSAFFVDIDGLWTYRFIIDPDKKTE